MNQMKTACTNVIKDSDIEYDTASVLLLKSFQLLQDGYEKLPF